MFLPLLAFFCIGVLSVGSVELPSYIPKCSMTDPNINQCIVEKGNACLPRLVLGDNTLAIPPMAPLNISELVMEGNDLEMQWFGLYTDGMRNIRLTDFLFLLGPNTTSYYAGYINRVDMMGQNYNILRGNVAGIPAYGNGKFNVTFLGLTVNVTGTMTLYEKGGETYMNVGDIKITSNIRRAYYHFENIKSPCEDDVNAYIEQHWEELTDQLEPAVSIQFGAYSNYVIDALTSKVPVDKIFLP